MKGSSKSPFAVNAAGSQDTSSSAAPASTPGARTPEDRLISLVRVIARQAAREWAEQRLKHASPTAPLPREEKPR
jgi:hypothetical protein